MVVLQLDDVHQQDGDERRGWPVLHQCLTIDEQVLEDGLVVQSERERLQTLRKSLLVDYLYVAITLRCLPAEHIYQHILAYKGAALRLSENRRCAISPS